MSDEQSTIEPAAGAGGPGHAVGTGEVAAQSTGEIAYDPAAGDDQGWDEPVEDLPRRPRRRLLGVGGNPIALALLGVLLIACGFIGGVLVEKGQSTSSSPAGAAGTGLASRFAALRGVGGGGGSGGAGATGATAGQVAYVSGSTLYVTTAEGNTVKVTTSPASTITKTVKAEVKGIHPGETVLVTGTAGKNGAISAESIRAGAGGAGGGGLGALFGGSGAGGGGRGGTGGGSSTGGEPALFGKGG